MSSPRRPRRILVVEDEANIAQTLRYNLAREGYEVSEASTGSRALELAREVRPDLVLLDLMLPEMSGLEVCRVLRSEMTTPILMLTAKASEIDTVVGLQVGADDYVTKPFSLNELLARVAAMLRRAELGGGAPDRPGEVEELGSFRLDRAARTVSVAGEELHLSPKEFDLLSLLLANSGRVLSRSTIIHRVWGSKFFGDHKTVDVHVRWLREKFEPFETLPFRITTVFGVGYRLDRSAAATASLSQT
ncbi:MAG: response regulator transcription factor [Candidatus Dormibacteria bacterium]